MCIRENYENIEKEILSKYGVKACDSLGRDEEEKQCDIRTVFQRDRDRIVHSKSFRRLMHKTQVFISPEGDHFRTRLTHTIEVSQISRIIARALRLNEDLTEAIALGHDIGHTPFGHSGEEVLNRIHFEGFKHNKHSLRVVKYLEKRDNKFGLNLTKEVQDGILNHTGSVLPFTLEGQIVKISDRIAYINHDIDDAIRSGMISLNDLPKDATKYLGKTHSERINSLVLDIINSSQDRNKIYQSEDASFHMNELRNFMFKAVYHSQEVRNAENIEKVNNSIEFMYDFYSNNPDYIPDEYSEVVKRDGVKVAAKDAIASMTDRYAISTYNELKKLDK